MSSRKVVYVAGPISRGDLVENITQAHAAGVALMKAGITPIVPHGSVFWGNTIVSGTFVPEALPAGTTVEDWYGMDEALVARSDAVLRLEGASTGADLEVAQALREGKPIFYSIEEVVAWFSPVACCH